MTAQRTLALALTAWLLPAAASGQELPLRTGTAAGCQLDAAAIRDSLDFTLFLTPPRSVPQARRGRDEYTPYINAVASTFEQPSRLSISYWPGTWADEQAKSTSSVGDCDAWCSVGPLEGEVQLRFRQGRLANVSWWVTPDSPEVMAALERAVRQADSLSLFPSRHKLSGLPGGTVRLALRLARWPPMIGGVPIGKMRLPQIQGTRPVGIIFQPVPHFPAAAADYGLSGVVSMQFVVGEDGLVAEGSIRILEAEEAAFIPPAMRAIQGSRFRPAEAGGCPIRQLVKQRVAFRR